MAEVIKWDTVAGVSVGLSIHDVVAKNRVTGDVQTIHLKGRNFYCRQCEMAEEIGGIVIPEALRVNTQFLLVLGVGEGCGKYHKLTKKQKEMRDMASSVVLGVKPYYKIIAPETHGWGITRSHLRPDNEFLINECIVAAAIPLEESEDGK